MRSVTVGSGRGYGRGARLAAVSIDSRKWFDRSQPQTLQIATWLLYINAFFALIDLFDESGYLGYVRARYGFVSSSASPSSPPTSSVPS